ncbi:MAG: hypothetical protein LBU97_03190, partial [Alistipes sp.]|nr:hypothetical protein [Alistipes sp.]
MPATKAPAKSSPFRFARPTSPAHRTFKSLIFTLLAVALSGCISDSGVGPGSQTPQTPEIPDTPETPLAGTPVLFSTTIAKTRASGSMW